MIKIVPAILTADPIDLDEKIFQVEKFSQWIQIDVADGVFVPNRTIDLEGLSRIESDLKFEFHLMTQEPQMYVRTIEGIVLPPLKNHTIIFHIEAVRDPTFVLNKIRDFGFQAGLALNPGTALEQIINYVDKTDLILFLTVEPGFQGREFEPTVLEKIAGFRKKYKDKPVGVDGGIKEDNILQVLPYNVNEIVVGSGLWQTEDPAETYNRLQKIVLGAERAGPE